MAHQNLKLSRVAPSLNASRICALALASALVACGSSPQAAPPQAPTPAPANAASDLPLDASAWGEIHSQRFELTVRVPDAKNWSVAKSPKPVFVAEHKKSRTAILATTFVDSDLVNRAICEEKTRNLGLVPKAMSNAHTIEDESMVGPQDFDTRVWVSLRPGEHGELVGDVLAFGAHVRKCLFFHFATIAASEKDADALSERLAAARLHVLGDLKLDAIEDVPRIPEH